MGRRHFTSPWLVANGESLSADFTGQWTDVTQYDHVLFLVNWSGDANGEIIVEISNDRSNVHALDFGDPIIIDDVPEKSHLISVQSIAQKYMRIKFKRASGNGNLTINQTMISRGA